MSITLILHTIKSLFKSGHKSKMFTEKNLEKYKNDMRGKKISHRTIPWVALYRNQIEDQTAATLLIG